MTTKNLTKTQETILKGLYFDKNKLFEDIDNIQNKIKKLTLED